MVATKGCHMSRSPEHSKGKATAESPLPRRERIKRVSASEHMDLGHLLPVEMSREVAK